MQNNPKTRLSTFFDSYLGYVSGGETNPFYDRWSAITGLGAYIGRQVWLEQGRIKIFPNMYVLLLGSPGTKKSTSIKSIKKLLTLAGYEDFAAEKTSKEKFLMDLAGVTDGDKEGDMMANFLDSPFGDTIATPEVFIVADEFNEFFGNNILDFVSCLSDLWDKEGKYESRVKNSKSIVLQDPFVSLLGGNTQETLASTFPAQSIGQGFFSRVVAVYAKPTGIKITRPRKQDEDETIELVTMLQNIKTKCVGEVKLSEEGWALVDEIYKTWNPIDDPRFQYYVNRRLNHLLKLVLLHTVAQCKMIAGIEEVRYANTVLHHTEFFMPKAFGAFGQTIQAAQMNKIIQYLDNAGRPLTVDEIWQGVQGDIADIHKFNTLIHGMIVAKSLQAIKDIGLLPIHKPLEERKDNQVDYDYLTDRERSFV